jgi:hypothetical protein
MKFCEKDEQNWELVVKDLSQESWIMSVNKLTCVVQFREGDIYRVRGVTVI